MAFDGPDLFTMMGAMAAEFAVSTYHARRVARTEPEDTGGIGLSTCWVDDFGCYETAYIDANGCHPVERYSTREEAAMGHAKWAAAAKPGSRVVQLGCPAMDLPDKEIVLSAQS